jgi:hypothetical protein
VLKITTDPGQRKVVERLFLEAEAKLKTIGEDCKAKEPAATGIVRLSLLDPN